MILSSWPQRAQPRWSSPFVFLPLACPSQRLSGELSRPARYEWISDPWSMVSNGFYSQISVWVRVAVEDCACSLWSDHRHYDQLLVQDMLSALALAFVVLSRFLCTRSARSHVGHWKVIKCSIFFRFRPDLYCYRMTKKLTLIWARNIVFSGPACIVGIISRLCSPPTVNFWATIKTCAGSPGRACFSRMSVTLPTDRFEPWKKIGVNCRSMLAAVRSLPQSRILQNYPIW